MKVMHGDSIEARVGALGVQLEKLEQRMEENFEVVGERFEQVDKRFEQVDKRFEQVNRRFEQVDKRFELHFEQADKRLEQHFEQVDKRLEALDADLKHQGRITKEGFERIDDKFDGFARSFVVGVGAVTAGYMAGFAGLITLVATQI